MTWRKSSLMASVVSLAGLISVGCGSSSVPAHEKPEPELLELHLGRPLVERPEKGGERVIEGLEYEFEQPREVVIRTPQGKQIRSHSATTSVWTSPAVIHRVML